MGGFFVSVTWLTGQTELFFAVKGEHELEAMHNRKVVTIIPHTARLIYVDNHLDTAFIYGGLKRNDGRARVAEGVATFGQDDLSSAPEWVRRLTADVAPSVVMHERLDQEDA
jgi:hypothetical protein